MRVSTRHGMDKKNGLVLIMRPVRRALTVVKLTPVSPLLNVQDGFTQTTRSKDQLLVRKALRRSFELLTKIRQCHLSLVVVWLPLVAHHYMW